MADGSMQFLLESVKQVFLYYGHLIADADTQIELLELDLRLFIAFLQESDKKRHNKDTLKELVRIIRNSVYEIEDVIEVFVIEATKKKKWHWPVKLINVAEKVKTINEKVNHILGPDRSRLITGEFFAGACETEIVKDKKIWKVRDDKIVGFEEETKTISGYLMEETEQLDTITIIGLPGLGKTTLAHKIFHHPQVQSHFPIRIWVNVSNDYTKKAVYLSILNEYKQFKKNLRNLPEIPPNMNQLTEQQITEILGDCLRSNKFLVVMDDVWTAQDWIDLAEIFLPAYKSSKILVTSRNEEVAQQANCNRDAFRPPLLTREESWLLLQLEVFGKAECSPDLEVFGKEIVHQCRGLPLAITVVGGILKKKSRSGDKMSKRNLWRKVSESVATYLNDDPENRMQDIISLSYLELPHYLRPCFLYLGMFPEDYAIPVRKLIWMWIAEDFVMQKKNVTLEEIARDYLEQLISRNLVMVEKISDTGNIKTCRLHDTIRQFCITQASVEQENFFQEVNLDKCTRDLAHCRRLSLHGNTSRTIPQLSGQRVRSLLIFYEENLFHPYKIKKAFKLLRILDTHSIVYHSLPKEYTKLVHLRFLVLRCQPKEQRKFHYLGRSEEKFEIPKAMSTLRNLQTLVVYHQEWSTLCKIKANIWKMGQLRHVKIDHRVVLPKLRNGKFGENLQSLGVVDAKCCTEEVFDRIRASLKKLSIVGDEVTLLKINGLSKLEKVEKLMIFHRGKEGQWLFREPLPRLPEPLPPNLRSLTLSCTKLEWNYMSTLGKLDTLEVLKLRKRAFEGRNWVASDGGFGRLEVLHICGLELSDWEAEANQFPRLKHVLVMSCPYLKKFPAGLCENLEKLELRYVNRSLANSARYIGYAREFQEKNQPNITKFQLHIENVHEDEGWVLPFL